MTPARLVGRPQPAPKHATIPAALRAAASTTHGLILVDAREQETPVSYAELHASARRVAAALLERGVKQGDRVALVLPTGRDFLDAFFGAQLAGAVPVPLYPPVRLGRMDEYVRATARMLTAVRASIVLSDRRVKLLLGQAIDLARPALGCPTVAELRNTQNEAEMPVAPETLGVIQFSSGSTVDPKPVALSQANLVAQCASLQALLVERPGTRHLGVSWLPLYHDMGLIGCLLSAVTFPGPLVLIPPEVFLAKPGIWLRTLSKHRGTISPAPNFAFGLCLKRVKDEELAGADLSHWTYALNGAEPVSADVMARFSENYGRFGFRREALMPVYGLSEASLAVTFTAAAGEKKVLGIDGLALASRGVVEPGKRSLVSVGVPVPGAQVEIRNDDGDLANEREVGHIFARGPSIMIGYFDHPEATAKALQEGWLDTGDLGFVDGGELFICGRAKDLVIIRGANHAPQEFEECLEHVVGVRTGCTVALGFVPPGEENEQLLILAETTEEATADLEHRIGSQIVEHTGIKPHSIRLVAPGTLPRTSSGKLRRSEALRRFLSGDLSAPASVNALTMTREMAKSALGYAKTRLG